MRRLRKYTFLVFVFVFTVLCSCSQDDSGNTTSKPSNDLFSPVDNGQPIRVPSHRAAVYVPNNYGSNPYYSGGMSYPYSSNYPYGSYVPPLYQSYVSPTYNYNYGYNSGYNPGYNTGNNGQYGLDVALDPLVSFADSVQAQYPGMVSIIRLQYGSTTDVFNDPIPSCGTWNFTITSDQRFAILKVRTRVSQGNIVLNNQNTITITNTTTSFLDGLIFGVFSNGNQYAGCYNGYPYGNCNGGRPTVGSLRIQGTVDTTSCQNNQAYPASTPMPTTYYGTGNSINVDLTQFVNTGGYIGYFQADFPGPDILKGRIINFDWNNWY